MEVINVCKKIKRKTHSFLFKPHIKVAGGYTPVWVGNEYGGYMILKERLPQKPIIFSFGIGKDISFDIEMIEKYGAEV